VASVWHNTDCSGTPVSWAVITMPAGVPCTDIACISTGELSVQTSCTTTFPSSVPDGMLGWFVYSGSSDCSGSPSAASAYTTGCSVVPGGLAVDFSCDSSGNANYALYNGGSCTGNPTASQDYKYGCIGAGGESIQQKTCDAGSGGQNINWDDYLNSYLSNVGQNWVISGFNTATTDYFKSAGSWTVDGTKVAVSVTFSASQPDSVIAGFVNSVCADLVKNANTGICTSHPIDCTVTADPITASCTYTITTSKRATNGTGSGSAIDISAAFGTPTTSPDNGGGLSGGAKAAIAICVIGFVLIVVAVAYYFMVHKKNVSDRV